MRPDPGLQLPKPIPGAIAIGSVQQAQRHAAAFDAVLSIEDPEPTTRFRRQPQHAYDRIALRFEDVDQEHARIWTPTIRDAERILAFGRKHAGSALLVHCHAGIARSTAAAYGIYMDRLGDAARALATLKSVRPPALPNLLLVRHLDAALDTGGAMLETRLEHEAGDAAITRKRDERSAFLRKNLLSYASKPSDLDAA